MALSTQAAAEYVGVTASRGLQSIGNAFDGAARWVGDHPLELAIGALVLLVLLKLLRAR